MVLHKVGSHANGAGPDSEDAISYFGPHVVKNEVFGFVRSYQGSKSSNTAGRSRTPETLDRLSARFSPQGKATPAVALIETPHLKTAKHPITEPAECPAPPHWCLDA